MNGKVIGAVAAIAGLLLLTRKGTAVTKDNVQSEVAKAIASKDPKRMAELSRELLRQGMTVQAAQLEAQAGLAKALGSGSPELQAAALTMVNNIRASDRYKENRSLVSAYQKLAKDLKVDGKYGPKTASTLATRLNMVPPCPIYWNASTSKQDKDQYRALLLERAANDTLRFQAWKDAADACK